MSTSVARELACVLAVGLLAVPAWADTFGTGANQFTMDFVTISGATNPTSGIPAGSGFTFTGVNNDYRMGKFEITNDQWNKFKASLGMPVIGNPSGAYDDNPYWTGTNVSTNNASWYEAAQFVNWLNTSTGHHAAYKFTGTQGTSNYTLSAWSAAEADNGTNLYRHKDAKYYLPTENEWVKAAYWNGMSLQSYATKNGATPIAGVNSNFGSGTPWNVGSGSEELNGTYDMMGNVWEWMESPYNDPSYGIGSNRALRGGSHSGSNYLASFSRFGGSAPYAEGYDGFGFRVASEVPEPLSVVSLLLGGLALLKRKRR